MLRCEADIRVLVIADPHVPVPPVHYGGTERIVALMCAGLQARGYTVDLMAGPGSQKFGGRLHIYLPSHGGKLHRGLTKAKFMAASARLVRGADAVITFGRPDYLAWIIRTPVPVVVRFGNPVSQDMIDWVTNRRLTRIRFLGISQSQMDGLTPTNRIDVVYNATNLSASRYAPIPADPPYFAYLGRLTANKGVHLAIAAAQEAGVRLKIAGTLSAEPGGSDYFATEVKPRLGAYVEYIGPVDDDHKVALLGGATGLLFPIQWPEPFGIVMAEALACGCPVIGWRKGSVPEVVRHGETGFVVESVAGMAAAIRDIGNIDRAACRRDAETRFSPDALVEAYLRVIEKLLKE